MIFESLARRFAAIKWGASPPRDPVVASWLGGHETASGQTVSEVTALNLSSVYCAVYIIASAIASLPFQVYRRVDDDASELAMDHPLYDVLHREANPEMSAMVAIQTMMGHALLWHGAYAEIQRTRRGTPAALWPIEPNRVMVRRDAGGTYYEVMQPTGGTVRIEREDMLHFGNIGFDGITGYSVVGLAREAIGLGMAVEQFGASFFGSGAVPSGVIYTQGQADAAAVQALRKQWTERHTGKLGVAILPDGVNKYEKIGVSPEDAQFLATREFAIEEIARWFNIPPHLLKDLRRATYANIEHQGIEFLMYTLLPWIKRIEAEVNRKLFSASERTTFFARFNVDGVQRADIGARYAAYATGINNGFLSPNDARRKENMNPIPNGDIYMRPANMLPDGALGRASPVEPRPASGGDGRALAEAMRPVFADITERMRTKEGNAIARAKKRDDFAQWLIRFGDEHRETLRGAMIPAIDALVGACRAIGATTATDVEVGAATAAIALSDCTALVAIARGEQATRVSWLDAVCERLGI